MFKWMMKRYKKWIIGFAIFCIFLLLFTYLAMLPNGPIPVGADLTKSDWLSFWSGYLSFVGTVAVAVVSLAQSSYHNEMENNRRKEERHKEIQPLFVIEIKSIDKSIPGIAESFDLQQRNEQKHKNVVIEIQIANNNPAKHVFIFDDHYLGPVILAGDKKQICIAYHDSPDAKRQNVFELTDDFERDEEGIPKWINIQYEDIDGHNMVQTFILRSDLDTKYYQLEEEPWQP